MISVVHLITGLSSGGAEAMLTKLVLGMDRSRFRLLVVSLTHAGMYGPQLEAQGIRVVCLGLNRPWKAPLVFWRLVRLLRRERPQVLQTWLYHADLLGLLAGRCVGVPVILWNIRCSWVPREPGKWLNWQLQKLLVRLSGWPHLVLANSQQGMETHRAAGYRPKHWKIIPNGFDLNVFTPQISSREALAQELGIPVQAYWVGLVARYHPMKNHALLLNAAAKLVQHGLNAHFILVGKGVDPSNTRLTQHLAQNNLASRVSLLGERTDVARISSTLDVACNCSSYGEGFPNAIGEAMACGVPCVVTDVGDSAWLVSDTGQVVPPANPAALAQAIEHILSLPLAERQRMGQAARQRIADMFSLPAILRQYETLYAELVADPRHQHPRAFLI